MDGTRSQSLHKDEAERETMVGVDWTSNGVLVSSFKPNEKRRRSRLWTNGTLKSSILTSDCYPGSEIVRLNLEPLFHKYEVDLVLGGHAHRCLFVPYVISTTVNTNWLATSECIPCSTPPFEAPTIHPKPQYTSPTVVEALTQLLPFGKHTHETYYVLCFHLIWAFLCIAISVLTGQRTNRTGLQFVWRVLVTPSSSN